MYPVVGASIAGYRLDAQIGRGGGGVVYRATHVRLDARRAVKVLAPEFADDVSFRRRFESEARLAAKLRHPHIVPVHDAGDVDGVLFLAMHLVDGPDLASLIRARGRLDPGRTCTLLRQIAGALDTAHRAGLVHRDVKPGNILIEPGDPEHAYLSDFGLTRTLEGASTSSSVVAGTLAYMAPERFRMNAAPEASADVYALGCTAYTCLSGSPPFDSDSLESLMAAHLFAPLPSLSASDPRIPPAVDAVLMRATAKDPAQRFPGCTAFVDALRAAIDSPRIVGAPFVAGDPARLSAPTMTVSQPPFVWVPPPPAPSPPAPPRRRRWPLVLGAVGLAVVIGATALVAVVVRRSEAPAVAAAAPTPLGPGLDALATGPDGGLYMAFSTGNVVMEREPSGVVRTVAGGNGRGFDGDGGPATAAKLNVPIGLAVDSAGTIYVADRLNNRLRRIGPDGLIDTVAGNGQAATSGDGGPATAAAINGPTDVATGADGAVYVAEGAGNRVRRISPNGTISTVAGNGTAGFTGDGGAASRAELNLPFSLATHGSDLYIGDYSNYRVRKVDIGGTITTVAGTGSSDSTGDGGPATRAQIRGPDGLATDAAGVLYIADPAAERVRRVDPTGTITTVAGTGTAGFAGDGAPAGQARLAVPEAVAVGRDGALLIADNNNARVRRVGSDSVITTLVGDGPDYPADGTPAVSAFLLGPLSVRGGPSGELFIADTGNERIRRVNSDGVISTIAGTGVAGRSGDGGPATAAQLNNPVDVAHDATGDTYIADSGNNLIRKVGTDGTITTVAGNGLNGYSPDGAMADNAPIGGPASVAVDSAGSVYFGENTYGRVRRVDPDGTISTVAGIGTKGYSGDGGPATKAQLSEPTGLTFAPDGTLYIFDQGNNTVRRMAPSGVITTVAGTGKPGFGGDGGPATRAQLNVPVTGAVDTAGNLYIADYGNRRIRRVDTAGVISTVAGTGGSGDPVNGTPAKTVPLSRPSAVAVDDRGRLLVSDSAQNKVYLIDGNGILSTVAGSSF